MSWARGAMALMVTVLLGVGPEAALAAKIHVAVGDFKNLSEGGAGAGVERQAMEAVAHALTGKDSLDVVEGATARLVLEQRSVSENLYEEGGKGEAPKMPGVDVLVLGTVRVDGSGVSLFLKAISLASGDILAAEHANGKTSEVRSLAASLAEKITPALEKGPQGEAAPAEGMPEGVRETGEEAGFKLVSVKASGKAPSERVALVIAQRAAVERAVGAYVDLKHAPNERQLVAKSSGGLSYKLLGSHEEGGNTVVEIEAQVRVPQEVVAAGQKAEEGTTPSETGMKPLKQPTQFGEIDWEKGIVTARGTGKYAESGKTAGLKACRAGKAEAMARAVEIVGGVRIDADGTITEAEKAAPRKAVEIKGLVQDAEVVAEDDRPAERRCEVTIHVPLVGVKGVIVVFLDEVPKKQKAEVEPETQTAEAEGEATGLIIDARGTGLKPALMPQVEDGDGKAVYGARDVDPEVLKNSGEASYATGEPAPPAPPPPEKKGSLETLPRFADRVGPRPLWVTAEGPEPPARPAAIELAAFVLNPASSGAILEAPLQLAQAARPRRVRQGRQPMTITAVKSQGKTGANIIISSKDAKKISKADRKGHFLKVARVVILTDPMVGGTEGRLWPSDLPREAFLSTGGLGL